MSNTHENLEDRLEQVFKKIARTNSTALENIRPSLELFSSENWTEKQLTRAILRIAASYRTRGQYGRLGAAVLFGSALLGQTFITRAERSGLFICDEMPLEKFRNFLKYLVRESESIADDSWRLLANRLRTYLIYCKLFEVTSRATDKAQKLLRTSPRKVIKCVLSLSQLHFLSKMDLQIPLGIGELLDQYGTPEELTSIISFIVATANKFKPLNSFDFAFSVAPDIIGDDVLRVLEYGNALHQRYEIAKDISLFGYDLELKEGNDNKQIFYLRPPSNEFEHAIKLGYIRSELGLSKAQTDPKKQAGRAMSILGFAELVVARLRNEIYEHRDPNTSYSRIVFKFPASQELYKIVLKGGFYEDLVERERFSQDFMIPVSRKGAPELQLTDTLNLSTFLKIWRLLHFICITDICVLRSFKKIDSTTLFNSLIRVFKEENLLELIASVDIDREQIKEFLRLVSANVEHLGFLDLQYRPFLKIASATKGNITSPAEIIHVPALVSFANILRNVQSANQLRLKQNAELFVEAVAFNLKKYFKKVAINRRVKANGKSTDIDIIVFEGKKLYLFECKHSIPPTSSHEMRDIWEDIERGTEQLMIARDILAGPDRLLNYLTGWFPGTKNADVKDLKIVECVLSSHRIFAGMSYNDIPIRDYSSLAKLTEDGIMGMGVQKDGKSIMHQFRVTKEESFSASDLDDYLDKEAKFFKTFRPFMHPVSKLTKTGKTFVARETYVYEVDTDEWIDNMTALGFVRMEDERTEVIEPWMGTDLEKYFKSKSNSKKNESSATDL